MSRAQISPQTAPADERPPEAEASGVEVAPLSEQEANRLNLQTEREARQQAEVGRIVRGGGG